MTNEELLALLVDLYGYVAGIRDADGPVTYDPAVREQAALDAERIQAAEVELAGLIGRAA